MALDTMIKVGGLAWTDLGTKYESVPKSSEEIVKGAKLNWTVNHEHMYTETHGKIGGYNTIYREDNNRILGVVNKPRITHTQNIDAFRAMEPLIEQGVISVDTSACFGGTDSVFATFKINESYKILDDSLDHYFVVINDHLKPDGKVTVLNTPVRVACMNALSAALSANLYNMRVPISSEIGVNRNTASHIIMEAENAVRQLNEKAEKMATQKIDRAGVEKLLDLLFPMVPPNELDLGRSKANETAEVLRMTFLQECMDADNLQNYKGTQFQIFQAVTDFDSHYFKKVDQGYDLNYRMNRLRGVGTAYSETTTSKYMKYRAQLAA